MNGLFVVLTIARFSSDEFNHHAVHGASCQRCDATQSQMSIRRRSGCSLLPMLHNIEEYDVYWQRDPE